MVKVQRHWAEIPLTVLSVVLGVAICAVVDWLIFVAPDNEVIIDAVAGYFDTDSETVSAIADFGASLGIIATVVLVIFVFWELFRNYGNAAARDIHVTPTMLSELCEANERYSEKIGMKYAPNLYITLKSPPYNEVLGVKIRDKYFVRIDAGLGKGGYQNRNYLPGTKLFLAKEIAHIRLGHTGVLFNVLTFLARCIPVYKQLYNRVLEYSADMMAMEMMEEDAVEAMGMLLVHPRIYQYLNAAELFQEDYRQYPRSLRFSMLLDNLFADESLPQFRLEVFKHQRKYGRLF